MVRLPAIGRPEDSLEGGKEGDVLIEWGGKAEDYREGGEPGRKGSNLSEGGCPNSKKKEESPFRGVSIEVVDGKKKEDKEKI